MNRTIYLIRHAEAVHRPGMQADIDRELTVQGTEQANQAGIFLKNKNIVFDLVLCSPANRTQTTAMLIAKEMGISESKIVVDKILFHANTSDCYSIAQNVSDELKHIAFVGHNPTISSFAASLIRSTLDDFAPCTIAAIQIELEKWRDLESHNGHLLFTHSPSIF